MREVSSSNYYYSFVSQQDAPRVDEVDLEHNVSKFTLVPCAPFTIALLYYTVPDFNIDSMQLSLM